MRVTVVADRPHLVPSTWLDRVHFTHRVHLVGRDVSSTGARSVVASGGDRKPRSVGSRARLVAWSFLAFAAVAVAVWAWPSFRLDSASVSQELPQKPRLQAGTEERAVAAGAKESTAEVPTRKRALLSPSNGALVLEVEDPTSRPLEGVRIRLIPGVPAAGATSAGEPQNESGTMVRRSGTDGRVTFEDLPIGEYRLAVEDVGDRVCRFDARASVVQLPDTVDGENGSRIQLDPSTLSKPGWRAGERMSGPIPVRADQRTVTRVRLYAPAIVCGSIPGGFDAATLLLKHAESGVLTTFEARFEGSEFAFRDLPAWGVHHLVGFVRRGDRCELVSARSFEVAEGGLTDVGAVVVGADSVEYHVHPRTKTLGAIEPPPDVLPRSRFGLALTKGGDRWIQADLELSADRPSTIVGPPGITTVRVGALECRSVDGWTAIPKISGGAFRAGSALIVDVILWRPE